MNKCFVSGRLTADPIIRTVNLQGVEAKVCNFDIAVNRKNHAGVETTAFFKITAWRNLAEACAAHLAKGRKVNVVGPVKLDSYQANGNYYNKLAITADEIEFDDRPIAAPAKVTADEQQDDVPVPVSDDEVLGL